MLDTKNFTNRTGGRTFEAAAYLRRPGPTPQDVQRMFQSDLNSMIARYDIIRQAELYRDDIAVVALDQECDRVTAAKAADELLTLRGIRASFVLYPKGDGMYISARSLGEINVQVILEALGRRRQLHHRRRPVRTTSPWRRPRQSCCRPSTSTLKIKVKEIQI